MYDFYRAAALVPKVRVADTEFNKEAILTKLTEAYEYDAGIIAFPELSITGYTCQDLFLQSTLYDNAMRAMSEIVATTENRSEIVIIGSPVKVNSKLYNSAFVIIGGKVIGISVKTFIPNHNEFYEKRWFTSAVDLDVDFVYASEIGFELEEDYEIPIGNNIVYDLENGLKFGVEICEDLWATVPPSTWLTLGGAEMIINLSASNELITKRDYRRSLVKQASASGYCEYLYVSAGASESTQDLVFSGHSLLAENGTILNENRDVVADDYIMIADMDLGKIRADRLKSTTFADSAAYNKDILSDIVTVKCTGYDVVDSDGKYIIAPEHPFIPASKDKRVRRCNDIFDMQVAGLIKRLTVTGSKPVVGVSGGMDSTLTLLVCAKALRKMKKEPGELIAITMPAFGTTDRTYRNSIDLIKSLGADPLVIDIKDACLQHYKDIGHDIEVKDVTYENVQARERTQVLMDYANSHGGIVIGTGDLSELALGWCTYNADQMSMYNVNGSIPKTLVRWMIDSVVENDLFPESTEILKDILDTPISPELLPPDENGNIVQKTEDSVGPYELHDFFLYYSFRYGYTPSKVFVLARKAFREKYTDKEILKWMKLFYTRFFNQQFKRSCMPDGIKVGSVSLSPRGDLRMPSDASSRIWLDEVAELENRYVL